MKSRARVLVLCLLCVARASIALPSEEIAEIKARSAAHVQDLSNTSVQESNGTDDQVADKLRDKRALGLLLSGLAQIFGYTVTPIQIATLPNPNITIPAAMSSLKPQVASSRPANVTAPRQRETIRFTGVLNFGNNSDILGHLQRYEQMFHGPRNNTTTTTTLRPPPKLILPPAQVTLDPGINPPPTRPPLLAPFFVKIPLPIAPELLSAAVPEDLTLTYPVPAITPVAGESNENAEPLIRKEQETVYKNEDSVRGQKARAERLKEQEKHRNREKPPCRNDETRERYKDREEEIDNRNRQHASKNKSTEKKRPTHDDEDEDEDSAEKYEDEPKSPRGSSRRPPEKNDEDKAEDYSDRDESDERNKPFSGYQQPQNFDKYIEAAYNRPLPIGDYFHEGNPEVIRDSYGEVLDGKKLEDDKLAEFINMFKHPHSDTYASQEARDPEDASGEDGKEESSADGYNEHLARLQKLREEYAPPENKYEEYDLNDERKTDRNDRKSDRNRVSAGSKKSKTSKQTTINRENDRQKLPTVPRTKDGPRNDAVRPAAQQDVDFRKYTPLIVPVRYIDVNDKLQEATVQRLNYKKMNKHTNQSQSVDNRFTKIFPENKMESTVATLQEKFSQQAIFPEKIRQLHEGEYKELQVFPPPFDYAYDNTKPESVIVPANLQINPQNYQPIVKNNANNDQSSQERSGYSVVIANPVYPVYRYPQNIYYYSNEATNPQNQAAHLSGEGTQDPRHQIYVPQQSNNQQVIQANPNLTEYNLNETKNSYLYYYQPQEIPASVLDRYRYIFGEQASQAEESSNIDVKSQIPNAENWSKRIYRPQTQSDAVEQSFSSLPQRQNVATSNYNAQSEPLERSRNMQPKIQNSKPEEQRKNIEETEIPLRQYIPKSFDDPQTAHDFFGFSKNDYSFRDESNDESTFAEENGKTAKESLVLVAPEPVAAHYNDESIAKHADELENNPEKAKVKEYRNRVATLRVSEQRQTRPNGPIHYVDFIRNI